MKQTLHVNVGNYDIDITNENFSKLKNDLDYFLSGKKRLIVISKNVYKLYQPEFNFDEEELLIIPDGEKEKNLKNYIKILKRAEEMGLTRSDVIVAFGGGVIGDLAGFAASTYMRGIDYIQIPTTLLSMVDSSVGGKTAVDMGDAKNIVGAFWQPKKVFININFLKTLDKKQFYSGLGEILKYSFIENSCNMQQPIFLYEYLNLCYKKLFELDSVTIIRVIDYCLKLKISIVNQDEKESNLRKILNLGHTLAHALEEITHYRKYTHGEAVIYGVYFAFKIAYQKGMINYSYYRLSMELLEKYGFKKHGLEKRFNADKLISFMQKDKKAELNTIVLVLPSEKKEVSVVKISPSEMLDLIKSEYPQF